MNKKEKAKAERENIEAELLEKYVEGDSNIDYDKVKSEDFWEVSLFKSEGEVKAPLMSKEEWLKREVAKIEAVKPKIPAYKVQDPNAKVLNYRQKFVELAKQIQPHIIEDLKELSPFFNILFANESKKYYEILNDLPPKLFRNWRIYPHQSNMSIFEFERGYQWGLLEMTYNLSCINYRMSVYDSSEIPESILKIIEDNKYTLKAFTDTIKESFRVTAENQESILENFFLLKDGLYSWAKKYHLQKDWLIEYAHYFIYQFSQNPNLEAKDVEVGRANYNYGRTLYYPFKFETGGWWAAGEGETANQYKVRVRKKFEEELDLYINEASDTLKLNQLSQATNPPTYTNVKWLVYGTVKGWSAERIIEKFFPEIVADKTKNELSFLTFENKVKHVKSEMKKLKEFDLPLPENL